MIDKQLDYVEKILQAWAGWSFRQGPKLLIIVGILASLALVYAVLNLKVNSDAKNLINNDLPYRVAEDAYYRAFPDQEETLLVVVKASTEAEADTVSRELTAKLVNSPVIKSTFAPTIHPFFEKNGLLLQSSAELDKTLGNLNQAAPLIRQLGENPPLGSLFASLLEAEENIEENELSRTNLDQFYGEIARIMAATRAGERLKLDWQKTLDGRNFDEDSDAAQQVTRLITITPEFDFTSLNPARAVLETVQTAIREISLDPRFQNIDIGITGTQALRSEELQSVTRGIGFALLTSLIMVAGLLLFALKSGRMTGIAVLVLLVSLSFSLAFAAAILPPLNLVSVAFGVLLIGLGIDFVIHLTMDILDRMASGQDRESALKYSLTDIGPALFLAVATTIIALLSFIPTDFHGMAQLGQISSVAVFIAFAATLTIVPASLPLLPAPEKAREDKTARLRLPAPAARSLRWGVCLLTLAALPFAARIYFDSDPMSMRDPASPSVITFQSLTGDPDTTPYRLNALFDTVAEAKKAAKEAKADPLIDRAITLTSFVPDEQDEKLDLIDFAAEKLLQDIEAEAQLLNFDGDARLMLAQKLASQPAGSAAAALEQELMAYDSQYAAAYQDALLSDWGTVIRRLAARLSPEPITIETLPVELRDRYIGKDGQIRVEFIPARDVTETADRQAFVEAAKKYSPAVSGASQVYIESGKVIANAMLQAGALAAILVTILIVALTRQLGLIILVLVPIAMAGILAGAAAYLIGQPLNFSNVIALPLLIGLGVDSGIHLAARRSDKAKDGSDIYRTSTPKAVTFSALTTIVAFGSLAASAHRGTASMGLLLAISIACILLTTIPLIPAWSDHFHARAERKKKNGRQTTGN